MKKKNNQLSDFQKIILYFTIYAFIGWIAEEIFCLIYTHEFTKRGFLFGPICPIYGYGAIILIIFFKDYKKKPIKLFFGTIIYNIWIYNRLLFTSTFWITLVGLHRAILKSKWKSNIKLQRSLGNICPNIYKYNTTNCHKNSRKTPK